MNKIFIFQHQRYIIGLVLVFFVFDINSQVSNFCKAIPPHQSNSQNPDSIHYDRFGNSYDNTMDSTQQLIFEVCNSGYINLIYEGNFSIEMMDCICDVFNYVFNEQDGIITRRSNNLSCNEPVLEEPINIVIKEDNLIHYMAASASYAPFPSRGDCDNLTVNRAYQKLNGGYVLPARNASQSTVDGRILLNSNVNWNTSFDNPPSSNQLDLSSAVFHGIMHILGFASLLNTSGTSNLSNMLEVYDKYLKVVPYYGQVSGSQAVLINNSNCTENCWYLNTQVFPNTGDFANAIRDNCSTSGSYDFVFDDQIAPILGGKGVLPNDNPQSQAFIGDMLTHLHQDCNSQTTTPYVMGDDLFEGDRRLNLTSAEVNILCKLGYLFDNMDCCFNVAHREPILNNAEDEDCCSRLYYVCQGEQLDISIQELLCNDFSNGQNPQHQITDVFTDPLNDPNMTITFDNDEIHITPHTQKIKTIYYTVSSCDCKMHNASFTIEVGPCLECNNGACQNLACSNGFEEFEPRIGDPIKPLYPLIALSSGIYWRFDTPIKNNTPDVCQDATGNRYAHMAVTHNNEGVEGLCFKLKEALPFGCKINLALDLAKHNTSQNNTRPITLQILGSQVPPCSALDIPVNLGCMSTSCTNNNYDPICLGTIAITNYVTASSCGHNVNFQNYTIDWISNLSNNPGMQGIEYVTLYPGPDPDPLVQENINVFMDNVVITKTCFCEEQINETHISCPERSFQPNCIVNNHEYSWTSSDGGSSNSSTFYRTLDNKDYTITLTITDDCNNTKIITKEVQVRCCPCQENNCIQIGSPGVTTKVFNDITMTTLSDFSEVCYNVCGVLDVNQNFSIDFATLNMSPGSEIIVRTGITLKILGSVIEGCQSMWKGITLENGAHIDLNGNFIRDAQFAINCTGSVVFDNATSNHFENNYVSIYSPPGSFKLIMTPNFVDNWFIFEAFKAFYQGQSPQPQTRSFAGIEMNNSQLILTQASNFFENLQNGIIGRNSFITASECIMTDLIKEQDNADNCNPAYKNANGMGFYLLGSTAILSNNFITNSTCAVLADFTYLDVRENIINGYFVDGIYSVRCWWKQIIDDNSISGFSHRGISIVDPSNFGLTPIITNNEIYSGVPFLRPPHCEGPYAIFLRNVHSQSLGQIELNDPIEINGNFSGIRLRECSNIGIQSNVIEFTSLPWLNPGFSYAGLAGIFLDRTEFCQIYSNRVTGFSPQDNEAFFILHSKSNKYCCNESDITSTGFQFLGACNPSYFYTSLIGQHEIGLDIAPNGAEIGLQYDRGNQWLAASTSYDAYNGNGYGLITLRSQFSVGTCNSDFWPATIFPIQTICSSNPNDWFMDSDPNQACPNSNCTPIVFPLVPNPTGEYMVIDFNDELIARRTDEFMIAGWESRENLMYRLLSNTNLLGQNAIIDSFYDASLETNVEKYAKVLKSINNALYISNPNNEELESNFLAIRTGIENCNSLDSLYALAASHEDTMAINGQKITVFNSMNSNYQNILNLRDILTLQNANELDLAIAQNDSLIPLNIFQENEKLVHSVFLNTVAKGIDSFTYDQASILYEIANQCPNVGGKYVYFARDLYDNIELLEYNDSILCQQAQLILLGEDDKFNILENTASIVNVFPNPVNGTLNIAFHQTLSSNNINIEIFNVCGEKVISNRDAISTHVNQFTLNTKFLEDGIYHIKILEGDKIIRFQKILIFK